MSVFGNGNEYNTVIPDDEDIMDSQSIFSKDSDLEGKLQGGSFLNLRRGGRLTRNRWWWLQEQAAECLGMGFPLPLKLQIG
jgi:hypothetical protein